MDRSDLMDRIQDIQDRNYDLFIGVNEADLATREEIADLFEILLKEAREGKPVSDSDANDNKHAVIGSVVKCMNCLKPMTLVRPGKYQCDNKYCLTTDR
jgi:hypothetical protein